MPPHPPERMRLLSSKTPSIGNGAFLGSPWRIPGRHWGWRTRRSVCQNLNPPRFMSLHHDPEGNESTLHPTTALSLIIPAEQEVLLYASFDGSWEQAAVLYLNGQRFENQL